MKTVRTVLVSLIILSIVPCAFGQRGRRAAERAQDARTRARHYGYEVRRDDVKERQLADEEAARAATLTKSEQTKATVQQQSTAVTQPSTALKMRQRLALIGNQIQQLEKERLATTDPVRIAEIDERIEGLNQEATGLKTSLGIPAE